MPDRDEPPDSYFGDVVTAPSGRTPILGGGGERLAPRKGSPKAKPAPQDAPDEPQPASPAPLRSLLRNWGSPEWLDLDGFLCHDKCWGNIYEVEGMTMQRRACTACPVVWVRRCNADPWIRG